jgi:glycosyltransferase involved in cell wall biosynthesis
LNYSTTIIATTEGYAKNSPQLQKYFYKVTIIPNGVDCNLFKPVTNVRELKQKYGFKLNIKIILFVGSLDSYKGCEYLFNSFFEIQKIIEDIHLIFVGKGPLEKSLKKNAIDHNISENISFVGYVNDQDLPSYYAMADVFVLPSISPLEGFGIVQLEAMATGKPVITTTIPGVSEVDPEELATIHVPPKNIQALSNALIRVLQDENLKNRLGENGRKLVIEKYSWEKLAGTLEEIYFKIQGTSL